MPVWYTPAFLPSMESTKGSGAPCFIEARTSDNLAMSEAVHVDAVDRSNDVPGVDRDQICRRFERRDRALFRHVLHLDPSAQIAAACPEASKPSTALSHEHDVGTHWNVQRGCGASHARTLGYYGWRNCRG